MNALNAILRTLAISKQLKIGFGEALYALSQMKLPGNSIEDTRAYEDLWAGSSRKRSPFRPTSVPLATWSGSRTTHRA